jgi:lysophospholipase L1-like esterase
VVRELGSSWVYINATPAAGNAVPTLPTTSNSHWELLAQAGSNGTGAVDLVNGQSGTVVLDGSDIDADHTATNYSPAGSSVADHLAAIDLAVAAATDNTSTCPRFHAYGGQLRALHGALTSPTDQLTTINVVGDSIAWGRSLTENATSSPRDATPSDPRDNFDTASFVNQFKRHIGLEYFDSASPTLSNWADSSSGQSTAEYTKTVYLDPENPPFETVVTGASISATKLATPAAQLGYRYIISDANIAGTSYVDVSFPFTGTTFAVIFTSIAAASSMYYNVLVNGVDLGVDYDTWTGVVANKQRREHVITYVRDATITIRSKRKDASGTDTLQLEAIEIPKTCKIVNQGIIGVTARSYLANMFGAFDTDTLTADVNFSMVMIGTNDRAAGFPTYSEYDGIGNFQSNLNSLIDELETSSEVVLLTPPPAVDNSAPTYAFNTGQVRDIITSVGASRRNDVIDCYAAFRGLSLTSYLTDGLHPNADGHTIIAENIIGALESAAGIWVAGPSASTDSHFALFDGPTGQLLKEAPTSNIATLMAASDPTIRLQETGSTGYLDIQAASATQAVMNFVSATTAIIDIYPTIGDGTSAALFRFFRATNSSGSCTLDVHKGNGTSTLNARLAGNTNSYVCGDNGNFGIGTSAPAVKCDINDDSVRVRTSQTPASAGATGLAGEIAWDASYIYVCTATNTWKRVAIATW